MNVQFHDKIKPPKTYVYHKSLDDKTFIKKTNQDVIAVLHNAH